MPGYKSLPDFLTGNAADQVREAEARHRTGDSAAAAHLLEEALAASLVVRPSYPGWLCGRLAALYRTLGRYDDEVELLERYRDSQTLEDARTRYEARLSKARTIAERKRRPSSGALDSVRASLRRPRSRRGRTSAAITPPDGEISDSAVVALTHALHAEAPRHEALLRASLARLIDEGRAVHAPVETVVRALKTAAARSDGMEAGTLSARYGAALVHLLALYFEEDAE